MAVLHVFDPVSAGESVTLEFDVTDQRSRQKLQPSAVTVFVFDAERYIEGTVTDGDETTFEDSDLVAVENDTYNDLTALLTASDGSVSYMVQVLDFAAGVFTVGELPEGMAADWTYRILGTPLVYEDTGTAVGCRVSYQVTPTLGITDRPRRCKVLFWLTIGSDVRLVIGDLEVRPSL